MKPTRSAFWKCHFFGSIYCLSGCVHEPPCLANGVWRTRTECKSEHPVSGKLNVCRAPDCPCWAGNAHVQLSISSLRNTFIMDAYHFLSWCIEADQRTNSLPVADIGMWLRMYDILEIEDCGHLYPAQAVEEIERFHLVFEKVYHRLRKERADLEDEEV